MSDPAQPCRRCHYAPPLPLQAAPFVRQPPDLRAMGQHLVSTWQPLGTRVFLLLTAWAVWAWFTPSPAEGQTFAAGWVDRIWLRNLVLVGVETGLLHWRLWVRRAQGDTVRYDRRELGHGKKIFLFDYQVKDNVFLTMVPAMIIGSAWEPLS